MSTQARFEQLLAAEPKEDADYRLWGVWHDWANYAHEYLQERPEVGMPATLTVGSDRLAFTVSRVGKGRLWAKPDKARALTGDRYLYLPDDSAAEQLFIFSRKMRVHTYGTMTLRLGMRNTYYDPSF